MVGVKVQPAPYVCVGAPDPRRSCAAIGRDTSASPATTMSAIRFMSGSQLATSPALRNDDRIARPQEERLHVAVEHLLVVEADRLDRAAVAGAQHLDFLGVREFLEAARHRER